jgi:hypothetical protein
MNCFSSPLDSFGASDEENVTNAQLEQFASLKTYEPSKSASSGTNGWDVINNILTAGWNTVGKPLLEQEILGKFGTPKALITVNGKQLPVYGTPGNYYSVTSAGQVVNLPPEASFMEKYGMIIGVSVAAILVLVLISRKK